MDREKIDRIKRGKENRKAKDLRPVRKIDTNWQLIRVDDIEYTQDKSGVYVYINWDVLTESARLDIMAVADAVPLQSFIGKADNVRKATMRWFISALYGGPYNPDMVSLEHAAYIGAELERCDTERIDYIQS